MVTYALVIATVVLVIDLYAGTRTRREEVDRIRQDLTVWPRPMPSCVWVATAPPTPSPTAWAA